MNTSKIELHIGLIIQELFFPVGESQVKTKIALVRRCDAAGLHVGAMLQLLKPACAPCPEDPARPDGLTGLESSRFCQSAELTEAPSERGEAFGAVRDHRHLVVI